MAMSSPAKGHGEPPVADLTGNLRSATKSATSEIPRRGGAAPPGHGILPKAVLLGAHENDRTELIAKIWRSKSAPLQRYGLVRGGADAHAVERAVDEEKRDGEKDGREDVC
jgi:hypothetical protein